MTKKEMTWEEEEEEEEEEEKEKEEEEDEEEEEVIRESPGSRRLTVEPQELQDLGRLK